MDSRPVTPTVSVVIPTYNRADLLQRAIRSACAQTLAPHEILVVDDGSSEDIAAACASLDARVRVIRRANGGCAAARNTGVAHATGEWLAFLDSDDLWTPDKLEIQLAVLGLEGGHWAASGCSIIGQADEVLPRDGYRAAFAVFRETELRPQEFLATWMAPRSAVVGGRSWPYFVGDVWRALFLGNFILPSSVVVRRAAFAEAGGFDDGWRLAEETEFFHRLAARERLVLVDAPLVGYRTGRGDSLVSPANVPKLIEAAIESGERALRLRDDPEAAPIASRGRRRLLRKLAWSHVSEGRGREGRAALRRLWREEGPSPWWLGAMTVSMIPEPALNALRQLKRGLR